MAMVCRKEEYLHSNISKQFITKCATSTVSYCHMNCCMVTNCRTKQPRVPVLKKLQSRALKDNVVLIPNNLLGTQKA